MSETTIRFDKLSCRIKHLINSGKVSWKRNNTI